MPEATEVSVAQDYEAIRERLLERRSELEHRIERITEDVRRTGKPLDQDFAEQAVERENDEVMDALGAAARAELQQIRKALKRIDNSEYGFCVDCGEPIPLKRLETLPFSERCVACQEKDDAGA